MQLLYLEPCPTTMTRTPSVLTEPLRKALLATQTTFMHKLSLYVPTTFQIPRTYATFTVLRKWP